MRIFGCTLRWGPYNVLLHFSNLDIPWIEKLDDALLASLGISQKMHICTAINKNNTFANILKTNNGRAIKSVSI